MNTNIEQSAAQTLTEDIKYPLPTSIGSLVRGIRTITINSDKTAYTDAGEVISVEINSQDGFLDCLRSYLTLDVLITGTAAQAAVAKLDGSVTRLFSRCRVVAQSGLILSDVERFDIISDILTKNIPTDYKQSTLGLIFGDATVNQHTAAIRYYVPLWGSGILSSKKLLPLLAMPGIRLELTLNSAANCIRHGDDGHTTVGITVSNVRYHACIIHMADVLNAQVKKIINTSGRIMIPYFDYHNQNFNIAGAGVVSLDLRKAANDIRSIYAIVRNNAALARSDDKYASVPGGGVTGVQAKIGSHNFPTEQPLQNTVEQYIEFRKAFNQFQHIVHPAISYLDYRTTSHIAALDLECIPSSYGSGVSSMNGQFLSLSLNPGIANTTINTYLLFSRILEIQPNKVLSVQE